MSQHSGATNIDNQAGFVAILATVTITIVLSAVTISFAKLMQREQRQALDRQLSTQAFYAAESGVNYAIKTDLPDKTDCTSPKSRLGTVISYPCLLVNSQPHELVYDRINPEEATTLNIMSFVDEFTFAWEAPKDQNSAWAGLPFPQFPPSGVWGNRVGVLEVKMYPIRPGPVASTADLLNWQRTFYLYPVSGGGGTVNYGSQDGEIVAGNCDANNKPKKCTVKVTGLGATGGAAGYVVRLRSIYNSVAVQINGDNYSDPNPTKLTGAQRIIDSTGKANDVLRRVQVRLPIRPSLSGPLHSIETTETLCKQLETEPASSNDRC